MAKAFPVLTLLLVACTQQPPSPQQCEALMAPKAVIQRCMGGDLQSGKYIGDLKCWPFSPPQRIRGFWMIGMEASEFYPTVHAVQENYRISRDWKPGVWLSSDLVERRPELLAAAQGAGNRVYAVDFDGRRALCDGMFGHFGIYPREVIAERFYSVRLLPNSSW